MQPTAEQMAAADAAQLFIGDYFLHLIAEKRRTPGEDLLSKLATAEVGGDRLTDDELVTLASLLFAAGFETTTNLFGNGVLGLLRQPEQLALLRRDASLFANLPDEFLRPPVCRLMDYGKYKYEEARRAREARKKQHTMQVKEVKYRPGIEVHDYDFKTRNVRRFLEDGDKVKVTMMFRGRQLAHPEFGVEVLERVVADVEDVGKIESQPAREGRTLIMVLAPLNSK
jgi:translation initiation factor IF-3